MADFFRGVLMRQHFCFHTKLCLEFRVVDSGVPGGNDQNGGVVYAEGQGFRNAAGGTVQRLRRQLHSGAGNGEFQDPVFGTVFGKPVPYFFNGHWAFSSYDGEKVSSTGY